MRLNFLTFLMFVCSWCFTPIIAQTLSVKGTITDESKMPVPGVSVVIKGTSKGTSADFDGKYEIHAKKGDVLVFSAVGFSSEERTVMGGGNSLIINVLLKEEAQQLSEVVVVGFGTQKKENLTGSIAVVDTKVLESRPVNNAVQALQGAVSGMNFSVGTGGGQLNNSLSINIRGGGTIGAGSNSSPLVLIDGMEGDLTALNPNDIESISVLKDAASSSIYGSRAAFGVILVKTKSGKEGKVQITYNNNFRLSEAINTPQMLDSESFAYYWNEAGANEGAGNIPFSDDIIENIKLYKAGKLKTATQWNTKSLSWDGYTKSWDNVNWFDQYYRKWAPAQEHNLSVRGGNENTNYYFSLNWLGQEGLVRYNTDLSDRYTANLKISSLILPYLRLEYNSRFSRKDYSQPTYMSGLFFHNIARRWPTLPIYDGNGYYFKGNEIAQLEEMGRVKNQSDILAQQLTLIFTPLEGWTTNIELNYKTENEFQQTPTLPVYSYDDLGNPIAFSWDSAAAAGYTNIYEYAGKTNFFNTNIYSSYQKHFGDHFFKVLGGFQSELNKTRSLSASRDVLLSTSVLAINATAGENDNVTGEYQHWATAGFFGRLNYDYKGRYLVEGNIRYDGSSRFLRDQRWNVFTSASVGWNIAKENFWAGLGKFGESVSEFKFKASYGELGNQATSNWYPFYSKMSIGAGNGNWLINNQKTNTASMPALISSLLTWEKVASWNIGFDLAAFQNRLKFGLDIFRRDTNGMVGPAPQLPSTLGTSPAAFNNTDMKSEGFDLQLGWNDKIGEDFSYGIMATLTDSKQTVTKYPNETGSISTWYDGRVSGDFWGLTTVGIAKTNQEMQDHLAKVDQSRAGSNWAAGDIMYADLNGDGKIDSGAGTLSDHGDYSIIGNSTPRYNFGVNIDLKYKNVDFSIFLQGTGKRDFLVSGEPYFRGANQNMWQSAGFAEHLDYFRPEDTNSPFGANVDSYYPRPLFNQGGKNFIAQTRWVQDASYMRIKNIQIGYTFPEEIMKKIGVNKLRIYASVENLATFTKLSNIFDPEANSGAWGSGKLYPLSRVISTGLSLNF